MKEEERKRKKKKERKAKIRNRLNAKHNKQTRTNQTGK